MGYNYIKREYTQSAKNIARTLINPFRLEMFRKRWARINPNNGTYPMNIFPIDMVTVGVGSYGGLNIHYYNNKNNPDAHLDIGCFCSIADNVHFLIGGKHSMDYFSTYPFSVLYDETIDMRRGGGKTNVQDDVWIGFGATILSGVTIGKGAVVGAGSTVAKDIPPYAVYAGGKVIKYRFSEPIINKLMCIDYSNLDESVIKKIWHRSITNNTIDEIVGLMRYGAEIN